MTKNIVIAALSMLIIIAALVFSIWIMTRNADIRLEGSPATATIVSRGGVPPLFWRPVEFITTDGRFVWNAEVWTFGSVGSSVDIYYLPFSPTMIAVQGIEWGIVTLFLLNGLMVIAFVFFVAKKIVKKVDKKADRKTKQK